MNEQKLNFACLCKRVFGTFWLPCGCYNNVKGRQVMVPPEGQICFLAKHVYKKDMHKRKKKKKHRN